MMLDRLLNEILPHRMQAVETLNLALWLDSKFSDPPRLEIFIAGKLRSGNLRMLDPDVALSRYAGGRNEAERALLTVFRDEQGRRSCHSRPRLIEIASRGVPSLLVSYLY